MLINGAELKEDYLASPDSTKPIMETCSWKIPEQCLFVLGDNRTSSKDSREYGPIAYDKIIGKVEK